MRHPFDLEPADLEALALDFERTISPHSTTCLTARW